MPIKEMFLTYVELQRAARADLLAYGPKDNRTTRSYDRANEQKRKVLHAIEDLEWRMEGLEK